jgi:hypothetical protein
MSRDLDKTKRTLKQGEMQKMDISTIIIRKEEEHSIRRKLIRTGRRGGK